MDLIGEFVKLALIIAFIVGIGAMFYYQMRHAKDNLDNYQPTTPETCADIHSHLWVNGRCPVCSEDGPESAQ